MADKAVKSIFDLDEFKPFEPLYLARVGYFQRWEKYYNGTMYDGAGFAGLQRVMACNVEALFLPLSRAVALDVALVPGGWKLEALPQGEREQSALNALFKQSRWRVEGDLFVHFGAAMGHSLIKVVDDRVKGEVRLQAFRPDAVLPIYASAYSQEMMAAIVLGSKSILNKETGKAETVEIAEVITPDEVRTYQKGVLAPIAPGHKAVEKNVLGFVPFVECRFIETGQAFGEPTFKRSTKALDKVNELATYLHLIIKRHAEPQWAILGDVEPTDLEKSGDDVWFIPGGSDVKAIVAAVDVDGVRQFINDILVEMKDSLPELNVSKLVGVNRVAAATIELQMSEATAKIKRIRDSVDVALAEAVRMAGRAAQTIEGQGHLAVLDDEGIAFDRERPVFSMDPLTMMEIETARNAVAMGDLAISQQGMLQGDGLGKDEGGRMKDE